MRVPSRRVPGTKTGQEPGLDALDTSPMVPAQTRQNFAKRHLGEDLFHGSVVMTCSQPQVSLTARQAAVECRQNDAISLAVHGPPSNDPHEVWSLQENSVQHPVCCIRAKSPLGAKLKAMVHSHYALAPCVARRGRLQCIKLWPKSSGNSPHDLHGENVSLESTHTPWRDF